MTLYGIYLTGEEYFWGELPHDVDKERIIKNSLISGTLSGIAEAEKNYGISFESNISMIKYQGGNSLAELARVGKLGSYDREKLDKKINMLKSHVKPKKITSLYGIPKKLEIIIDKKMHPVYGTVIRDRISVLDKDIEIYRFKELRLDEMF